MDRITSIISSLEKEYQGATCELNFRNNYELIVAVILSAQCTDKRVNEVTPKLFSVCPDFNSLSEVDIRVLEELIRSCGFFRSKAKNLKAMASEVCKNFGGVLPTEKRDLLSLAGVGEKTANVIVAEAYKIPAIAVDTHVFRVSNRLGLARAKNVMRTQKQLEKNLPKEKWILLHHALILHGRYVCKAIRPNCEDCNMKKYCRHYEEKVLPTLASSTGVAFKKIIKRQSKR